MMADTLLYQFGIFEDLLLACTPGLRFKIMPISIRSWYKQIGKLFVDLCVVVQVAATPTVPWNTFIQ